MKLIILAAGSGTRLRPYTDSLPKCMVPVLGRPLIDRLMDSIRAAGIDNVVIVRGYQADRLELSGDDLPANFSFVLNPEFATTNMIYSLWTARHEITDPVIISYADILYEPQVLKALIAVPDDISVVVDRDWRAYWERRFDDPLSDAESLSVDGAGNIESIGQKASDANDIRGQYIGLMKFSGGGVDALTAAMEAHHRGEGTSTRNFHQMYMTDLLQGMIDGGTRIRPVWIDGGWVEVDSVKDLKIAEACIPAGQATATGGLKIVRDAKGPEAKT